MLARSHVVIAGATWAAIWTRPAPLLTAPLLVVPGTEVDRAAAALVTLLAVVVGALLPDLDHPGAWLAQFRLSDRGLLRWVRPLAFPSLVLREQFGHRGALHSLAAVTILWFGSRAFLEPNGLTPIGDALTWGYAAHLIADALTRRGVPLLWPLWHGPVRLPRFLAVRTGSLGEAIYLLLVLAVTWAYVAAG